MREFIFTAHAVDGSHEPQKAIVSADDEKQAEKKARTLFNYPVRLERFYPMNNPLWDLMR